MQCKVSSRSLMDLMQAAGMKAAVGNKGSSYLHTPLALTPGSAPSSSRDERRKGYVSWTGLEPSYAPFEGHPVYSIEQLRVLSVRPAWMQPKMDPHWILACLRENYREEADDLFSDGVVCPGLFPEPIRPREPDEPPARLKGITPPPPAVKPKPKSKAAERRPRGNRAGKRKEEWADYFAQKRMSKK